MNEAIALAIAAALTSEDRAAVAALLAEHTTKDEEAIYAALYAAAFAPRLACQISDAISEYHAAAHNAEIGAEWDEEDE